jgi:putative GTP pyrophosphokinase
MADISLSVEQERGIDELVAYYEANNGLIRRHLASLDGFISGSEMLAPLIHSVKQRMKDPIRLRDKLVSKFKKLLEQGRPFHITKENLFTEITDLAGYRILHLHTTQMDKIDKALRQVFDEAQCTLIEGPKANVWDQESQKYFERIGISTEYNPRMYSSVYYVVQPNSKAKVTIEIQVRTLSEEVWGEVDHRFNYPQPVDSVACSEQIKVLARVASSCTRLVDSIFASYADWQAAKKTPPK